MATEHGAIPAEDSALYGHELRLELLRLMLLHRLTEERVMALYRQGRISGSVYTGRGQEAVGAAAGLALGPDDVVAPLNRELGCHYARGVTPAEAFANFLAKGDGPTRGRDGNMHFGVPARGVFPLVSMLGDLCPLVVGAALAFKRRREPRVSLTFWGDGAMSVGDVHEGLNLAAVLRVPVVFVMQSNGYAYSTPTAHQMVNPNMAERVTGGWGVPAETVDGTDAIVTYSAIRAAVERARAGEGPQAVECISMRIDGHAAHDDGKYMDQDRRREYIERRDPIERLLARLRLDGADDEDLAAAQAAALDEVNAGLADAESRPAPDPAGLADGVYASPLA